MTMRHLFVCTICERDIADFDCRNGRDRHLEPICNYCEGAYADRGPAAGHFMDRRIAIRLSALANALHSKASCIEWEGRYGRA